MLILLDIDNKPGDCKACKFYARGCAVKLLHKCPLQDGIKAVELSSWGEICNADRIFGIKQEDSKND